MTTEQLIERITTATKEGDWPAVQEYMGQLHKLMRDNGRPISAGGTFRLVEALSNGTARNAGSKPNPYALVNQIKEAAKNLPSEYKQLIRSWEILYALLADPTAQVDDDTVRDVLTALKSVRMFDLLAKTSERALIHLPDDTSVRCLYGQALIDSGQMHAGIEMLQSISKMGNVPHAVQSEASGLVGRAYKQIYLNNVGAAPDVASVRTRFRPELEASIRAYSACYDPDFPGENYWHGINLIALLIRARNDGHRDIVNPSAIAPERLARRLIAALEPRAEGADDPWILATLGEAYLALNDYENAADFFGRYVSNKKTDAFNLASTIRQLEQLWGLTPMHGGGGAILSVLKEALITQPEAAFRLPSKSLNEMAEFAKSPPHKRAFETMFKGVGYQRLDEIQTIVARARSVTAMKHRDYGTIGTGFLIKGSDLHDALGDDHYVLTNAHVVGDPNEDSGWFEPDTMEPADIDIVLEGAGSMRLQFDPTVEWQSPSNLHDATLLKVENVPADIETMPFPAPEVKLKPDDDGRDGTAVSVIGHPLGGPLSLSRVFDLTGANGMLVDYGPRRKGEDDPVYLHYRAATQPGNSGSPVFETKHWTVIGLHHAGFNENAGGLPRLTGKAGTQVANEGICLRSIRHAIGQHFAARRPKKNLFGR